LAERFKRTYISAREFVNSWEKEIYELNNLDYFIFLSMNDLGTLIEQKFFKEIDRKDSLYLNSEEISNLVFNLGDSLQMFFEKNCFGACELRCPSRLNESLTFEEQQLRQGIISVFDNHASKCQTKDQCLYLDLMNYVVLDTLIDFYNYELNVVLDESDLNLLRFAEFIMDIILDLIKQKGQHLLARPQENAGGLFEDSLKNDETPWSEILPDMDDDEDEESELWKIGGAHISDIFLEFREQNELIYDENVLKALRKFEEYLIDFLEIRNFDEVDTQDLEEFFLVILLNDLIDQDASAIDRILDMFRNLFNHIEFQYDCDIKELFDSTNFSPDDLKRVMDFNREYQAHHPLLNYLLSPESQNDTQVEGFYEVVKKSGAYLVLKDIHLNTVFRPVGFERLESSNFLHGDILHVQMNLEQVGWRICRLEMLYPPQSKPYLL
jgi:hypothetical protein